MVAYIAFNLIIFMSYVSIPMSVATLAGKWIGSRRGIDVTLPRLIGWTGFIVCCGVGHLIENVGAFYSPLYPVFTIWHGITAVFSVYTAISLTIALRRSMHVA